MNHISRFCFGAGRFDPVASAQPASAMDVSRPEITEEELNSEVELLRDEDLLKQVVMMAGLIPPDTPPPIGSPRSNVRRANLRAAWMWKR